MKLIAFTSVIAAFIVAGCANSYKPSLEELDADLSQNQLMSERFYPGKTIDEVRKASQRVLYLLDPPDMKFDVRADELLATRYSTYYAVLIVGHGRDWYSVSFTEKNGGTLAKFGFSGEMNNGPFVMPTAASFKSKIDVSALQNPSDFKLFHDRVEYLLGLRQTWTSCQQAKSEQLKRDKEMALCDSIGLENKEP